MLTTNEKIKVLLSRRGNMSVSKLAEKIGTSRQNLSNKLARGNFSEDDLLKISTALDCSIDIIFKMNDTGEEI